jgi:hypothetical protein
MSKKYRLPKEQVVDGLYEVADAAADAGDARLAEDYLVQAERAEDALEGVDVALRERVRDATAAVTNSPISNRREIGAVRRRLRAAADSALGAAAAELQGYEDRHLPDQRWAAFRRRVDSAMRSLEQDEALGQLVKQKGARVVSEPRTYGPDSPNSYFLDLRDKHLELAGSAKATQAQARLARYGQEIAHEIGRGSKEGRRAERCVREHTRTGHEDTHERLFREQRAMGTDGGASATSPGEAAAFVSPAFLVADWAPYRGKARSFADQCKSWPLPDYGMHVYVPFFNAGSTVTSQTENASVSASSPTAAFEGVEVKTATGEVLISQQLSDRGVTGGGAFDKLLGRQIQQQLEERVDLITLEAAITNGEAVSGQTEYKTKNLYQDIALAREKLTDTAGTRLRPTHFFTTSDLYSYATRQVDATTERPIVVPTFAPGFPITNGADDGPQSDKPRPKWSRFTGTVLPGGVLWFTDDNIPTEGTTTHTRLIVSAPDEAITLAEGEPILTSFTQTLATTLQVVVNLRSYVAVVTRHAAGTAYIQSAAYTTSLV